MLDHIQRADPEKSLKVFPKIFRLSSTGTRVRALQNCSMVRSKKCGFVGLDCLVSECSALADILFSLRTLNQLAAVLFRELPLNRTRAMCIYRSSIENLESYPTGKLTCIFCLLWHTVFVLDSE